MNNAITELGYLGFEVSNLGQWDQFATDVLGMATSQGSNAASRWLRMDEQRNRIILTEGPADDHAFAGWRVANAAAVEAFGRGLTSKGIAWTWGNQSCFSWSDLSPQLLQRRSWSAKRVTNASCALQLV